ncbi:uncharacterized protein LOC128198532 [Bicyclus anynana]|uniref:Uncharacterized protein LOC128198532 n=1 Tax=Bicyclus anynana TaxID=110368 RepID=A0ABM3LMW3_BICAN|nr:uncharacterized protein LOC128198532 [Bicyclus anynana]
MSSFKKSLKSKCSEDIYNPQDIDDSPPKIQKLKRDAEEKEFHNLSETQLTLAKKQKICQSDYDLCGESSQKLLNVMTRQLKVRKQIDDDVLMKLGEVITSAKTDHDVLKNDVQKFVQLSGCLTKCLQQSAEAYKEKLIAIDAVVASFQKTFKDLDAEHRIQAEMLASELEENTKKLKQKLISDTKRIQWENLQKNFFQSLPEHYLDD